MVQELSAARETMVRAAQRWRTIEMREEAIAVAILLALWLLVTAVAIYAAMSPIDRACGRCRALAGLLTGWRAALLDLVCRRYRRLRPAPPLPVGPPIEETAAALHRLQNWLDRYADPTPLPGKATRVAAVWLAYDRVLIDACVALEIRQGLEETEGIELEAERLRVQEALRQAGFVLGSPHRSGI